MCPNCEKKLSLKKSFLVLSVVALGLFGMESYASGTHGSHDHSKMDHSKMDHSAHAASDMDKTSGVAPIAPDAPLITAKVNGLVCDFCAQALKKVFKKEDAVENLSVDLDAGEVVIILKPGGVLDDARVKKLIRKSGYSLVSLERSGGA